MRRFLNGCYLKSIFKYAFTGVIIYLGILSIFVLLNKYYGLGVNMTTSEVRGWYYYYPISSHLKIGDMVIAEPVKQEWVYRRNYIKPHTYLLKTIAAMFPNYLVTRNRKIYSCANSKWDSTCRFLGECLKFDTKFRPMNCQYWNFNQILLHRFYLQSDKTPFSLDSRYLGLIPESDIKFKARLLWAWN